MLVSQPGLVQCLKLTHILQGEKRYASHAGIPTNITHLLLEKDTTDCYHFTPVLPHLKEP